jgi:hypothetical protein
MQFRCRLSWIYKFIIFSFILIAVINYVLIEKIGILKAFLSETHLFIWKNQLIKHENITFSLCM